MNKDFEEWWGLCSIEGPALKLDCLAAFEAGQESVTRTLRDPLSLAFAAGAVAITQGAEKQDKEEFSESPTLRDQFAMAATQTMLLRVEDYPPLEMAHYAYKFADAMLAEREK